MQNFKKVALALVLVLSLSGCKTQPPKIEIVCNYTDVCNYEIKWEVSPNTEGTVRIYQSANPYKFNTSKPVKEVKISDQRYIYIPTSRLQRNFFLLIFNNKYRYVIGAREAKLHDVDNFRDIGGYYTKDGHQIRWQAIYRSGKLDSVSQKNAVAIKRIFHPKTLIDLRSQEEFVLPKEELGLSVIHLPLLNGLKDKIEEKIRKDEFRRGDASLILEDSYIEMLRRNSNVFKQIFRMISEPDNYPVIISCEWGKDRTGLAIALILYTLGVDEETILEDFEISGKYLSSYCKEYTNLLKDKPLETQEAVSSLLSANRENIQNAFKFIKQEYGSLDYYLREELGVDEYRKQELKKALLIPRYGKQ